MPDCLKDCCCRFHSNCSLELWSTSFGSVLNAAFQCGGGVVVDPKKDLGPRRPDRSNFGCFLNQKPASRMNDPGSTSFSLRARLGYARLFERLLLQVPFKLFFGTVEYFLWKCSECSFPIPHPLPLRVSATSDAIFSVSSIG